MNVLYLLLGLLLSLALLSSCDSGGGESVVLDGPIMETFTERDEIEYNGAVTNISDISFSSVFVVITLKDEKGDVIDIKSVSVFDESEYVKLMPGESAFFTLDFKSNPDLVISKEVEVYYNE